MLQSMRHLAHSWVVKTLMLLLMVSFCLWGIGDIFRGNPLQKTVAKVGNADISVQQLNRLFESSLAQARQRISPELTSAQARQMGLLDKALENEIQRSLIDQDIKRLGIDVAPQEVLKLVAEQPDFRNKDGTFNKAMFQQLLEQQRLSEPAFVAQGQQDLSRQILLGGLGGSRFVPQTMVDALYKARAQQRVLEVVTIDATKLASVPAPDDKTLRDFYEKNPSPFTAPEYRGLTIATLSVDDLAKDVSISDEQVQKEYVAKGDELSHPEQRDVLQVVVQSEEEAKDLSRAARASGNLTQAAKAIKETAIPLDQLEEKNLMPALSKVVFAQNVGDVSEPIKTQLGWHVVQLKKITPPGKPDFESVKEKIRADLKRDQSVDASTRIVNQLDDELAAGHSLDDIAESMKLRLVKIPAVDASGLTPDGKSPSELPNKSETLKDAFSQNTGDTSPIEDDKAGHYFVVRTDDITPAAAKPFEAVKPQVADAWKLHEQMGKAQSVASDIVKQLQSGAALASLAKQDGVTVRMSLPLSQLGDTDPTLPTSLVSQAFKIKKGETATGTEGGKQVVVRLATISDVDLAKSDPRKNKIEGDVKAASGNEILEQYLLHLRNVFPVTINAETVDRLRQQDN